MNTISARPMRMAPALLALAVAALVLGACNGAAAKDRGWSVQDPLWTALPQSNGQAEAARTRAVAMARALGIPGNPSTVRRERDMMNGADYDAVEILSAAGDRAEIHLDPETHGPTMIVRFGPPDPSEPVTYTEGTAPGRAREFATVLGLPLPSEAPTVRWDDSLGTWTVSWDRLIDGHRALGDGVIIDVTPGGRFKALSATVTPSAPAPANPIPAGRAASIAKSYAADHGWSARPQFTQTDPVLVWVRANNFLDPSKSDAPEPLLRLAYEVTSSFIAIEGDEPHLEVLWISATDASLLGGTQTA
jgi:hypothetical protein